MQQLNEIVLPSCTLISSRGLASLCDVRISPLVSSSDALPEGLVERCGSKQHSGGGRRIYLCSDAVVKFVEQALERIQHPFVLVTGDSDNCLNDAFFSQAPIQRLLTNPLLEHWFAQNLTWRGSSKLTSLPIGLDYHTMWEKPGAWGITIQSALAQEQQLLQVFSESPSFRNRHVTCYCNFHFSPDRGDRLEAHRDLDREACIFELNPIPRLSTWQRQSQCMFVASPEGVGPDCHRTWEAIALGCVPIIKRGKHSDLFTDLPVVQVDEWRNVSRALLISKADELGGKKFNYNKMFLHYWRLRFQDPSKSVGWLPELTMNEFKFLTTARSY